MQSLFRKYRKERKRKERTLFQQCDRIHLRSGIKAQVPIVFGGLSLTWRGACRGLGKPSEADPLCRRALRIRERAYGAESPNVATALTALADVLKEMSRYGSLLYDMID